MTRVAETKTSMRLPHAVVSSHPAKTTDFIDDGAYMFDATPQTIHSVQTYSADGRVLSESFCLQGGPRK